MRTAALLLLLLALPPVGLAQIRGTLPPRAPTAPRGDPWRVQEPAGIRRVTIDFTAAAGEKLEYRFPVSRPGMVSAVARWKGAPRFARLEGPLSQPLVRRGEQRVRLRARATSDSVAKSTVWTFSLEPDRTDAAPVSGTIELAFPAGSDIELRERYDRFATAQSDARLVTLEQLRASLERDYDARRAAFEEARDPAREMRVLRCPQWNLRSEAKIEAKTAIDGFNCSGADISLFGMTRYGGPFSASRGEDLYFPTFRLKNGWTVDAILFRAIVSAEGEAEATRVESSTGGDSPAIRVRWWATPDDSVHYALLVSIVGPRGTPYE